MSSLDTALMNAVSFGNPEKVLPILQQGANPHVQNDGAMVIAINTFNIPLVELLLTWKQPNHQYPKDIMTYLMKNHLIKMIQ